MDRYREATPELVQAAKRLRADMTPAEVVLWNAIRRRQVGGARFRRQHPFAGYVLDFCCPEHLLVVEVDGAIHDTQQEADTARTAHLETYQFRVLRFRNDEVLSDLPSILQSILDAIEDAPSDLPPTDSPFPPRTGGRGLGG